MRRGSRSVDVSRGRRSRSRLSSRFCEPLEGRVMLCDIQWENRGSPGSDTDEFQKYYGSNAALARSIADRAIADWERIITNFNRDGENHLHLSLSARSLDDNTLGQTWAIHHWTGKPYSANIDMDSNGAGNGWYFDPSIGDSTVPDDGEFTTLVNRFAATGSMSGTDFYSVVLHELGHAVGIASDPGLLINDYLTGTGLADPNDTDEEIFTLNTGGGEIEATMTERGGLHFFEGPRVSTYPIHPDELMNPTTPTSTRRLITDLDAITLRDTFGYTIRFPSQTNTYYANLDRTTDTLTVRGDPDNAADIVFISVSGTDLSINVNSTIERIPITEVDDINVVTGGGNDTITVSSLPVGVHLTVNGGSGADTVTLSAPLNGIATTLNGGTGDDTIYVSNGNVNLGAGTLVINGDDGEDDLYIRDQSDTDDNTYTFRNNTFTKLDAGAFTYGSVENIVLQCGQGNDAVNLESINVMTVDAVTISGAAGNDTVEIGAGSIDFSIPREVDVYGVAGTDTLILTDYETHEATYTFTKTSFSKTGALWMDLAGLELIDFTNGGGAATINVDGSSDGTEITIDAGWGDDVIQAGGGDFAANIGGDLTINGGGDTDSLTLFDTYETGAQIYTLTGDSFTKSGFGALSYSGMEAVTLNAGSGNDIISIPSAASGVPMSAYGGNGDDAFLLAGGDIDTNLKAAVTVVGGNGTDALAISDIDDTGPDSYTFGHEYNLNKNTSHEIYFGASFESLLLVANDGNNIIYISELSRFMPTTVNGGGGDDTFWVGAGDIDLNVVGDVSLVGGDGVDEILLNDATDTGADTYTLGAGTFTKTGTGTIRYSAAESLVLNGNPSDNTINIDATLAETPVTVNSGAGDDIINVGAGDIDTNVTSNLSVNGGGGSDTLNLNDAADSGADGYSFTSSTFVKGMITVAYSAIERIVLNANASTNDVDVASTAAGCALVINTGAGNDSCRLSLYDRNLATIAGPVRVVGQGGADSVTLYDQGISDAVDYTIGGAFLMRGGVGVVAVEAVSTMVLWATGGDNNIYTHIVPAGLTLTLHGGNGNDTAELAHQPNDLGAIQGTVLFRGEGGSDTVRLYDEAAMLSSAYRVTSSDVTRTGFAGLNYGTTERIELRAQPTDNGIYIESTATGCEVNVSGAGGNDSLFVAHESGDLGKMLGPITFDGGLGSDYLTLYDDRVALASAYSIDVGSVSRRGFAGADFTSIERLELRGQTDANVFDLNGTNPQTVVALFGQGGADAFNINAAPASHVLIDGGDPVAAAGDILQVKGAAKSIGRYRPSASVAGAGTVYYGDQAIDFVSLEDHTGAVRVDTFSEFTLETAGSRDDLSIATAPLVPGQNLISGTSGAAQIAPLRFTNVKNFILNTGAADGAAPDDSVVISSSGLIAAGLSDFRYIGGSGEDSLTVNGGTLTLSRDAFPDTAHLALLVNADAAGTARVVFRASQHLRRLELGSGGTAALALGGDKVLVTDGLSIAGTGQLDLIDNDMILHHSDADHGAARVGELVGWLFSAMNGPTGWDGPGLTSTAAKNDPDGGITTLAIQSNDDGEGNPIWSEFAKESVDQNAVLVKYTWWGDCNLDGVVSGDDYGLMDAALLDPSMPKMWLFGDINYDGVVSGDDYSLIDAAFLGQRGRVLTTKISELPVRVTDEVLLLSADEPFSA